MSPLLWFAIGFLTGGVAVGWLFLWAFERRERVECHICGAMVDPFLDRATR